MGFGFVRGEYSLTLQFVADAITLVRGVFFGLSLIVAIGPQNTFVLRQGLTRRHVPIVVALCAGSDAILISLGVGGVGTAISEREWLAKPMYLFGSAFLLGYAFSSTKRAFQPEGSLFDVGVSHSLKRVMLTTLAFTWLNPHVYLDTVVLMGVVASSTNGSPVWFGVGAVAASFIWFSALGFGARLLRPFFTSPMSGRILDGVIGLAMLAMGISLVVRGLAA